MQSPEILEALHEITGCKIRSVYIVWSDLFIVLERMKRKRAYNLPTGFFGSVPSIESLSTPQDAMIDDTVTRSFYMAISTNAIILVDIKMSGLIETLRFNQMTDIVVLHDSIDPSLFSICFGVENDPGHALFKCFRRKELLGDLQVVLSAMIMLHTLQLHRTLLRYSDGGGSMNTTSTNTNKKNKDAKQNKNANKNANKNKNNTDDLPFAHEATPIDMDVDIDTNATNQNDLKNSNSKNIAVANAVPIDMKESSEKETKQSKVKGVGDDASLFEIAKPLIKSHRSTSSLNDAWKVCKLSIDTKEEGKNALPKGWKLFKFGGYCFASHSGFTEEIHDLNDLHKVGLFTQGYNRRDKTHFTIQFTIPKPIEKESESIEEVAMRYSREVGSQFQSSRILMKPTRYTERKTRGPNDGQWECVTMHIQTLGKADSLLKELKGTTYSSYSSNSHTSSSSMAASTASAGSTAATGSTAAAAATASSNNDADKYAGEGRDIIILVGRRRYLPPTMDTFQDVVLIFRAGIRKWHSTEPLLKLPKEMYKSLQPITIYVSDGMLELRKARTNALLLPPAGFIWYEQCLQLVPSHTSYYVHNFIVSLLYWLQRYNRMGNIEEKLINKLISATEEHPNGMIRDDLGIPQHPPLYYATLMENNPPGRINTTDDMTEMDASSSSILSSKLAIQAWKRRCWVYLSTLLDGGLDSKNLTLETLVHAYQGMQKRPNTQLQLGQLLDHCIHLHRCGMLYNGRVTLIETIEKWHPMEYEKCMFNPFVLHKLFQYRYIEDIMCTNRDPTRIEYVRFLLRMLTWQPQPSQPMMGFNVNNFRLLLCNLLAKESSDEHVVHSEDLGTHETKENNISHHKTKYKSNFYSDLTLTTWLDVLDQGEHGPEGAAEIALHQLICFTDFRNEDISNESRRIITDRITVRTRSLENIIALVSQKEDKLACMACALIRNLLESKNILRTQLLHMNFLPILFSVIVPAEKLNILIPYVTEEMNTAKESEKAPSGNYTTGTDASDTSGGEEDDTNNKIKPKSKRITFSDVKPSSKSKSMGGPKLLRRKKFHQDRKKKLKLKKKQRINPQPFRSLALIIEAISLLEVMAYDPNIKKYIHNIQHFSGAPSITTHIHSNVSNEHRLDLPICFYSLAILLYQPMAMVLVPDSPSVMGKEAAVVPLHNNVARTITALCRFDRRNKIAMSSATTPLLMQILETTKSHALQESLLSCIHSITTEFVNLKKEDQMLLGSEDFLYVLETLEKGQFQEHIKSVKELIINGK